MIFLREISKEDIPIINKWRNDKELQASLGAPFRYVNIETDQLWFDEYLTKRSKNIRLAICLADTNQMVGVCYLVNIDYVSRIAENAMMIGEKNYQNKEIGLIAATMLADYGFLSLNLNRIYSLIIEDNHRALNLNDAFGFHKEGLLRQSLYKNGIYYNQVVLSLLKHEYIENMPSIKNRIAKFMTRKIRNQMAAHDYGIAEISARWAISEYPDTSATPSLLSLLVKALEEGGKSEEAEKTRNCLAEKYPGWKDRGEG